jgi:heat shock protein HtpX
MWLMQMVVAINSRKNEFRADKYAFELGYGEKLLESFYLLEKITLGDNSAVIQRIIASHPRITARIEQLETLLDQEVPMQNNPWALN